MPEPNLDRIDTLDFAKAVVGINKRAERQHDPAKLIEIFVQTDLPTRSASTDHQIILGRRGTGKTHLMRYYQHCLEIEGGVVFYTDCTTLGSGLSSTNSTSISIAAKYFAALLNDIGSFLLDKAIQLEKPADGLQDRVLGSLANGLVRFLEPGKSDSESIFNYRQISDTLRMVLADLGIERIVIILDEWAQIPLNAQPYVAEFIKRALLTVPATSTKIIAVNYQCRFSEQINGTLIGLQRGADFTDIIDMDRYLVFDERSGFVKEFFGQLLYNHLGSELKWDLSLTPERKSRLMRQLFTQEATFVELVRAAEGNCRDFICIFAKAYLEGYRKSGHSNAVSMPNVCEASASWYSNEKEANIKAEPLPQQTINFLLDNVLKGYRSRTFLVESGKEEHPRLVRLLNERILHRLNEIYSHPDRPGLRYEIFTLDHGAFVRFRGTSNEPAQEIFLFASDLQDLSEQEKRHMVPIDDKRSIRRIVFDPEAITVKS